jgi:hypothetical protein
MYICICMAYLRLQQHARDIGFQTLLNCSVEPVVFVMGKFTRLDAFARGQILALAEEGLKPSAIRKKVTKKDGKSLPTQRCVQATIKKAAANPEWRGENADGGPGRPQIIPAALQKNSPNLSSKSEERTT